MQYLVLLLIEIEPSYLLVRSICILFHMVLFLFFNCCSLVSYFALTTSWSMDRRVITSICGRAHRARQDTEQSRARHRTRQDTEQGRTQSKAGHRAGQDTEQGRTQKMHLVIPYSLIIIPASAISCHWIILNTDNRVRLMLRISPSLKFSSCTSNNVISLCAIHRAKSMLPRIMMIR